MAQQQNNYIDIPINRGTYPDWNTRLGFPQIRNWYIGDSGFLYPMPGLDILNQINSCRSVHYTIYNGGAYIIVTNNQVYRVSGSTKSLIGTISFSGLPVQIDENLQNQITIVDGRKAYVYDQTSNRFVTLTEADNGFIFKSPCSVVVLNTFTIILDSDTGGWAISETNNALTWPALDTLPKIGSQLTKAVSLETLDNNLYIFGTTGIERWEANYNTNIYLFPFARDNNFRKDFGAIGTNAVIRGNGVIYFLSSKYVFMEMTHQQIKPMGIRSPDSENDNVTGMAKIISQYPDVTKCYASYYSFRGNYFYSFTFPKDDVVHEPYHARSPISWVFNENTDTFSLTDDYILGAAQSREVVIKEDGLYQLSVQPSYRQRTFIGERMVMYKGQQNYRNLMTGFEVRLTQGLNQLNNEPQELELFLSIDSKSWLNGVRRPLGLTGERNAITIWRTNLAAYEFTPRVEYFGNLNFAIEKMTTYIN